MIQDLVLGLVQTETESLDGVPLITFNSLFAFDFVSYSI